MPKEPQCDYVSNAGRRCFRELGHQPPHHLESDPTVTLSKHELADVEAEAVDVTPAPKLPERPESPRGQALEYREPEIGRLASALVYLVDTLREKWGMHV